MPKYEISPMAVIPFVFFCSITSLAAGLGNECLFPSNWQESTWLVGAVNQTKDVTLINYNIDNSCTTARSTAPSIKTNQYNCPAYSQLSDGTQIYLRAELEKQYMSNGLCIEQKRIGGVLVRREAGTQNNIESCKTALTDVNLYNVYLPVDPYRPDDIGFQYQTSWSVMTEVDCPMVGVFSVTCKLGDTYITHNSAVSNGGPEMNILIRGDPMRYPKLPLTGTITCLADLSATALGEQEDSDRVLVVRRTTNNQPDKVQFYCVRYRRFSNGTWSLSFDVQDTTRVECLRVARNDWNGMYGSPAREYFRLLLTPFFESTTPGAASTAMTTTSTKPPQTASLHHIQAVVGSSYATYASNEEKATELKADLRKSLAQICELASSNIIDIRTEAGKDGYIVATWDVNDFSTSVQSCEQKLNEFINAEKNITHNRVLIPLKRTVYTWRDDSLCPEIKCATGSYCWIRQGEYTCECADNFQDADGVCSKATAVELQYTDNKEIITFSVIGAAALLVIIAIIVTIVMVMKRRKAEKDLSSDVDSIGTLEQQDRDMYSSIGKKPTAYHDKQFIVTNDDEYLGEKTGIQNPSY